MRYFDFDPNWGAGGSLASMKTGEGDHYEIWFSPKGTVIAGFDPESKIASDPAPLRRARVYRGLPPALRQAKIEFDDVTFAAFRLPRAEEWTAHPVPSRARDPEGSERLLFALDGDPRTYVRHALAYFDAKIAVADVKEIYALRVDAEIVRRLNPKAKVASILAEAQALGFVVGKTSAPSPSAKRAKIPAAVSKLLQRFDPAVLAERLHTFALVDAIVASDARTIERESLGRDSLYTLHWGGAELHAFFSGRSAIWFGWSDGETDIVDHPSSMPAALASRFRAAVTSHARARLLAWSGGRDWHCDAFSASAAVPLECLSPNYLAWAKKHYGRALDVGAVTALWKHAALTERIAKSLAPDCDWPKVRAAAKAMKWP